MSGLAVNIAARIMGVAEPGQILASTVVTLATDNCRFETIGPLALEDLDGDWELHTTE